MAVKTIGVGSGIGTPDYSDIQAWWDARPTSATEAETGKILWASSANEIVTSNELLLDGITTNGFVHTLTAEAGDSICDTPGVLRYDATRGACIRQTSSSSNFRTIDIQTPNFVLERLMIKKSINYNEAVRTFNVDNVTLQNIVVCSDGDGACILLFGAGANTLLQNFVAYDLGSLGSGSQGVYLWGGDIKCYNGVIAHLGSATAVGLRHLYNSPVVKNVTVSGFTTDYSGSVSASSSNNATDLASFGGTNFGGSGQTSITASSEFENVTAGTEDFRLKSTSPKLKDNGTATSVPATDFFGQARVGNTDIGAHELQGGGASIVPLLMNRRRMMVG